MHGVQIWYMHVLHTKTISTTNVVNLFTARGHAGLGYLPFEQTDVHVWGPQQSDTEEVWQTAGLWLYAEESHGWTGEERGDVHTSTSVVGMNNANNALTCINAYKNIIHLF